MDLRHHHPYSMNVDAGSSGIAGDRFPQWSLQETRDFLMLRAELDANFIETKRNKPLWELISARMKEMGYNRNPDQCKCKWKNLVTRFKGSEAMEGEAMKQQFPFYKELQAIFGARMMQRMLWLEAEAGSTSTTKKKPDFSDEDEDGNDESEGEKGSQKKKRKMQIQTPNTGESRLINEVKEIMNEFMKQQMQMEMQWMKTYEAREEERRNREMEWKRRMEALENERVSFERNMKEKEEERRVREEARAEKRDALITALLNKLRREEK